MYDGCFGLSRRPFTSVPQVDHYFPAAAIEGARTTLARCIQRGEGAGLVIGPAGTGKTLLCLLLAEQFRRSFQVAILSSGRLSTRRALFQAILYELGRPYRGMDEGELRLAVIDYLTAGDGSSRGMVLLVDEAHTLPLRLLEEIRLLSNLARSGQPLVRLVLAGGPALEERLASPKLDSFNQRLSGRCYLEAFSRGETQEYIQSQINWAGGQGDLVFPEATCQTVFQATGGVVRLINQVCDHALLLAYVAGRKTIEPAGAEEAWADLQQLPTPAAAQSAGNPANGGVIEFGALDDATAGGNNSTGAMPTLAVGMSETEENELTPTASVGMAPANAPPTATVFRVAQIEDEETPPDDSEPAVQIHRIERLLAEAEEDFQPAGSIGPEVELCFEEAIHPFREEFEQEEVVSDRYAAAKAAAPLAVSQESASAWHDVGWDERSAVPPTAAEMAAETDGGTAHGWSHPTSNPTRQDAASTEAAETDAGMDAVGVAVELPPQPAVERRSQPALPPEPAPRHEFRQLFARLRRG